MKKLYLLRHGQTLFNLKDMVQGQCDSKLTSLGKAQSKAAGTFFAEQNIDFDHVYTSTLGRTEETLQQFYAGPYTRLKDLQERNYGILEGDSNFALAHFLNEPSCMEEAGIESDASLANRMISSLKTIMDQKDHQSVLAVVHGDCLLTFARAVDIDALGENPKFCNCVIYEFDYDEKESKFTLSNVYDEHIMAL